MGVFWVCDCRRFGRDYSRGSKTTGVEAYKGESYNYSGGYLNIVRSTAIWFILLSSCIRSLHAICRRHDGGWKRKISRHMPAIGVYSPGKKFQRGEQMDADATKYIIHVQKFVPESVNYVGGKGSDLLGRDWLWPRRTPPLKNLYGRLRRGQWRFWLKGYNTFWVGHKIGTIK